ncbi:MAG: DUF1631 family protein [Pseudomonadales bacterium]
MDQQFDPSNVFTAMHHRVTGELLRLMDGLYSNIEDGLFELAYRTDERRRKTYFDLMRELRHRRSQVIQNFARGMQGSLEAWFVDREEPRSPHEQVARAMAAKCTAHFGGVLQSLSERTAYALGRDDNEMELPIGPFRVACHFVGSLKALNFDDDAVDIVNDLFSRFVLDRMGSIYGECNQQLEQAGFFTSRELAMVASARA